MILLQIVVTISSFVIVNVNVNGFFIPNTNVQSTGRTFTTVTTRSVRVPFLQVAVTTGSTNKNSIIQNDNTVENVNDEITITTTTTTDTISSNKSKNQNQKNNNNYYVALEVFGSPSTIVSADSISSRTYRLLQTPIINSTWNTLESISNSVLMPLPLLKIQIGNVSIGRKAWKKRRRSNSPLLVPCSILSIPTYDAIRSNIIHIVQKYGRTSSSSTSTSTTTTGKNTVITDSSNNNNNMIIDEHYNDQHTVRLSLSDIIQRYETQFGRPRQRSISLSSSSSSSSSSSESVLQVHANEYGFTDVSQFILSMFGSDAVSNDSSTYTNDNNINNNNDIYIQSSLSKYKAQKRVQNSVLLQFTSSTTSTSTSTSTPVTPPVTSTAADEIVNTADADIDKEINTELYHTGFIRTRTKLKSFNNNNNVNDNDTDTTTDTASSTTTTDTTTGTTTTNNNNNNNNKYYYTYNYTPLSVAVRLSQEDVDSHYVTDNSIHTATIFAYDPHGDAGSPLITLSIARGGVPILSTTSSTSTSNTITSNSNPKKIGNNDDEEEKRIINTSKKQQKVIKIQDLKTGHKVKGTVVRLIKGGAIVDCNVISTTSSSTDETTMTQKKVFGFISFKDAYVPFTPDPYSTRSRNNNNNNNKKNTSRGRQFNQLDSNEEDDDDDDDISDKIWSLNDLDTMDDDDDDDEEVEDDEDDENDAKIQQMLDNIDLSELEEEDNDDDDTDVEDVTHLCVQNEDGSFTYTDPETGISEIVFAEFDHDHDHDDDDDDDDTVEDDNEEEEEDTTSEIKSSTSKDNTLSTTGSRMETTITNYWNNQNNKPIMKRQQLHRGDTMTFYIKYVPKVNQQQQHVGSTASNQFTVTLDSSIQGKDNKDIKYEKELSKKLSRLSNQLGGSLDYLQAIQGKESIGIVQATSNTKNNNSSSNTWLYVQPTGTDYKQLPVGIATIATTSTSEINQQEQQHFTKGDTVRIVFTGIDAQRGQLAMQILEKITSTSTSTN